MRLYTVSVRVGRVRVNKPAIKYNDAKTEIGIANPN